MKAQKKLLEFTARSDSWPFFCGFRRASHMSPCLAGGGKSADRARAWPIAARDGSAGDGEAAIRTAETARGSMAASAHP